MKKKSKKSKLPLVIRWTAGHEGLEGNELADREAKEAASGRSLDAKLLPSYLRKRLLISPTALKATHNAKLKKEWVDNWKKSERGIASARIDETTPSSKFLKSISNPKLSREAASRVAQLRLTHIPLNSYLTRIQKVDSARCPACGVDEENIEHYLLRCPSYAHERWPLVQLASKKRKPLTLRTLLGDPSFVLPLAAYTHATERFKQPGE
jgi:hypothetical protein